MCRAEGFSRSDLGTTDLQLVVVIFIWFWSRFERWLLYQLDVPSANRTSYEGNYTDDSETWRPVVLSRLVSPHLHELADKSICRSAGKRSCSIEAVLRATQRFQTWTHSNLLLPSMVQVCLCPKHCSTNHNIPATDRATYSPLCWAHGHWCLYYKISVSHSGCSTADSCLEHLII